MTPPHQRCPQCDAVLRPTTQRCPSCSFILEASFIPHEREPGVNEREETGTTGIRQGKRRNDRVKTRRQK